MKKEIIFRIAIAVLILTTGCTKSYYAVEVKGILHPVPEEVFRYFTHGDHIRNDRGVIYIDPKVIGLDFDGMNEEKALQLLSAHPEGARAVRIPVGLLCNEKVRKSILEKSGDELSITISDRNYADDKLKCLRFFAGKALYLWLPEQATDAGAPYLAALKKVRFLRIWQTRFTDESMKYIGEIDSLENVYVNSNISCDAVCALPKRHIRKVTRDNGLGCSCKK